MLFALPTGAYPRRAEVDLSGVDFLRTHLGSQRFVTLGPIAPNYGSYYGIAEVAHNDLPTPRVWTGYARRRIDPRLDPIVLTPDARSIVRRLSAWAAVGTSYVVSWNDQPLPLKRVHSDNAMTIYALPSPRPYLSAPGCVVTPRSRTEAIAACAAPSRLTRLEAFMPGWSATVNGRTSSVTLADEAFQATALPAGRSVVRFSFTPPWLWAGELAAALGASLLTVAWWLAGRPRDLNSPAPRAT